MVAGKLTVKQCHASTNEATKEVKYDFYEVLWAVSKQGLRRYNKIVMGDMNAKVGVDTNVYLPTLTPAGQFLTPD